MMCKIAWFGRGPIKSSPGTRHVAIGSRSMLLAVRPTLWRSHASLFTFLRFSPLVSCTILKHVAIGCSRARIRPHRREEGKEGGTTEEGSGEEGQDVLRIKERIAVVVSPSSCILRFPPCIAPMHTSMHMPTRPIYAPASMHHTHIPARVL